MKLSSLGTLAALALSLSFSSSVQAALVAHYKLDEANGPTAADSSGNGFNATATGAALTFGNPGVSVDAIGNTAGSGAYLAGPTTSSLGINGNNARSIAFWFNASSVPAENAAIGFGAGGGQQLVITVEDLSGSGNVVGLRYGNGNVGFNDGSAISTGTWYHVAVVYDGTTLEGSAAGNFNDTSGIYMYINGSLAQQSAGNLNNDNQALNTSNLPFYIANDNSKFNEFDGFIDDVQVYNNILTGSEVSFIFNNPGTAIPEPSSAALLLGFGALGLVLRRRS